MPSELSTFTLLSILFRPLSIEKNILFSFSSRMVEAPGTAPGSNKLITQTIYRHSHLYYIYDNDIIYMFCLYWKRVIKNK
ncbi:hypothetical protein lam_745 [Candidatus Liberibacter americanus str. Sao Paulo]|uniref:Uncharacterized protein n=1 Tax=Candidatus Liberibacter americanus str. Sao Paulo TaxID=1261131 RepID=U6B896_9HYPH|nr:hypothetical protein lam_745 [Candidatus Liberibacter americanus str. Sao Paulo]